MATPTPDHVKQHIISLYNSNLSIQDIYRRTRISQPTITKILKKAGIQIRRINYQQLPIDKDEVNRMYEEGKSTYQIAAHFKCSDETIRKMIDSMRDVVTRNKLGEESIAKIQVASKANWQDEEYRRKVKSGTSTPEYKARLTEAGRENYGTSLGAWIKTVEAKATISKAAKEKWQTPEYYQKQAVWFRERIYRISAAAQASLLDPRKRAIWIDKIRAVAATRMPKNGWVSTSQKQLYYILSSSGIEYHEEGPDTMIGPFYRVDCVIPKQQAMSRPLIVEVQGEYWHSLPRAMVKDRQKATYVRNHTDYDLLALDELKLASFTDVEAQLKTFGLTLTKTTCKPTELDIRKIDEQQASMFYSIFHYTGTVRKGAIVYGAFLGDELVAAISYCHPMRTETATRLGFQLSEVVEISRLARRTNVVCKNLASYLIARTTKLLPQQVRCVVSFSDCTYGHTGGVYKAANFVEDGVVAPDYHYVSINGKYHKKTIWDRSKRMKMTEAAYAEKHNLLKVQHGSKTRWLLKLR